MIEKDAAASVKTAARTLDVFEAFAAARQPLTLTELAEQINAPLSSCHALVKTLHARGYIYYFEWRRLIYPTKKLFDISVGIAAHDPVLQQLQPKLTELRHETGETVILGKRHGNEVVYLDVIEGTHTVRYTAHPGERKPLHSSATGKALLSTLSEKELSGFLERRTLKRMTPNTIVDAKTLRENIEHGRRDGFFVTRGENVADVVAIAMVLQIAGEKLAFAIAGPSTRLERNLGAYVANMRETIASIDA